MIKIIENVSWFDIEKACQILRFLKCKKKKLIFVKEEYENIKICSSCFLRKVHFLTDLLYFTKSNF